MAAVIVLVAAAGAFAFVRSRDDAADDPSREVVQKFADAWAKGDLDTAWKLTTPATQQDQPQRLFLQSYAQSTRAATVTRVKVGVASEPRAGKVAVPVVLTTKLFGRRRGTITFPVERTGDTARVAWTPDLRLPGLRPGEAVKRRLLRRPTRANVLDAFGRRLEREPSAAALVGSAPAGDQPGTGLEGLYDERLGGKPGAELRYGKRIMAKVPIVRGKSVRTTIRPSVQATATGALGGRLGGVAVVNPRTGAVLALSGLAVSGPQPPGSVFKIITLATALQHGVTKPSDSFPVQSAATLSGVKLRNAGDEQCGGSLTLSFAHSCNSVFGPLGAKLGAKRLVASAEAFGFNEALPIPGFKPSSIPPPGELRDDLAVGASAIGQDRDLATPLTMASVGATIANGGVRVKPRLVRSEPGGRRRVVRRSVAGQVRDMMLAVVREGTGTAAALPGIDVAGKTGTAELRPTADASPDPSNTDAWFVAFAPAGSPSVAVGVMLVGAGAGGAAAAPVAREVLASALG